jgi:hypothetical protein
MPVIIPEQHHAAWLGETDEGNAKELLVFYPAGQMRMWEISPRVNSPKNDDPSLWEPLRSESANFVFIPLQGSRVCHRNCEVKNCQRTKVTSFEKSPKLEELSAT